jgi:hypothetical protein
MAKMVACETRSKAWLVSTRCDGPMHENGSGDIPARLSTLVAITRKGSGRTFFEPNEPFTVSQALAG